MTTVVLVGAGNLGRRHLQSMKACKSELDIIVVDPFSDSLKLAKQAYEEIGLEGGVKTISYFSNISEYSGEINISVVATTASGRLDILKELVERGVTDVVLEKVAFNSVLDIEAATTLMVTNKVRGWVNCPRRMNSFYQSLAEELKGDDLNQFSVRGSNYGMACNAIHFIDLFAFLSSHQDYTINLSGVESVVQSKRDGYIEFFGTITGKFTDGPEFELVCDDSEEAISFCVEIETESKSIVVNEISRVVTVLDKGSNDSKELKFRQPYQSELTGPLIDQIIESGTSDLTVFGESMQLHKPFIKAAYELYENKYEVNTQKMVPIT